MRRVDRIQVDVAQNRRIVGVQLPGLTAGWAAYMAACFFVMADNRSIIYIDGFNLYYGMVKGGPHKWLDIQAYFERLRPHDDIQRIYYFKARIGGRHALHQSAFLAALSTLPLVEIRLGKFKSKKVKCTVRACPFTGRRKFRVPEEKQTDVAIGVQMLEDAYEDNCDRLVVVSGDSDLLPAVNAIRRISPSKKIIVYIPFRHEARGAAVELRRAAHKDRTLPDRLLGLSQFSDKIDDGRGGHILKPESW